MKIALCLSGYVRTYRRCFDALKAFVLEPLNPDVFIHTWDRESTDGEATDIDDIRSLYRPVSTLMEDRQAVPLHCLIDDSKWSGTVMPSLWPMTYSLFMANRLKQQSELSRGFSYDVVIRCRFDLLFQQSLAAWTPPFESTDPSVKSLCSAPRFQGLRVDKITDGTVYANLVRARGCWVSDLFAYGSSSAMDIYAAIYQHLDDLVEIAENRSAECLLADHLKGCGIKAVEHEVPFIIRRPKGYVPKAELLRYVLMEQEQERQDRERAPCA